MRRNRRISIGCEGLRRAAVGAAVAVTLGAGGVSLSQAAISSGEKPVYVALDAPCRVIDTRPTSPIGAGETNALTVQITGPNGDCTGNLAVPAAATNVTVIQPNGAPSGRSYFTVYPTDATRPTTSNLNFVNGQPPTPNKVDVGLSTTGHINIYNNEGTAHAAVDIFGYYIDHTHDDRYYTKTQTDTALNTKANTTDIYTKSEIDATTLWAVVDGAGVLVRGSNATNAARLSTGRYEVVFNRNVRECAHAVSAGEVDGDGFHTPRFITTAPRISNVNGVFVSSDNQAGTPLDAPFHLIVQC